MYIFADVKDRGASAIDDNKDQKFRFNFSAENAFKYDSSDNEVANETPEIEKTIDASKDNDHTNKLFESKSTLFFDSNDVRFNGMYVETTGDL